MSRPLFILVAPCPVCGAEVDLSKPGEHINVETHSIEEMEAAGINVVIK